MRMRAVFIILNMCHVVHVTAILFHAISPIPKPSNRYPDKLKKTNIISKIRKSSVKTKGFYITYSNELEMSSQHFLECLLIKV